MKSVTPDDLKSLGIRQRGNLSPAYLAVMNLEPGQMIIIEPQDWNRKTPPSVMVRQIMKKHGRRFTVATMTKHPGWLITRVS